MKMNGLQLFIVIFLLVHLECGKLSIQQKLTMNSLDQIKAESLKQQQTPQDNQEQENPDPNIIFRGWIKFQLIQTKFEKDKQTKYFEINQAYFKNNKKNDFDEFGSLNIPDDQHFFAQMTQNNLYITTARESDITRTYKSIDFKYIRNVFYNSKGEMDGGLMGINDQEDGQYCFKLRLSNQMSWVICTDDLEEKANWMKNLLAHLKMGPDDSVNDSYENGTPMRKGDVEVPFNTNINNNLGDDMADQDGKWVIINQWSQCTLACGGGDSYLQRKCMGQRGKGKKCQGEEILSKKCNTDPCPSLIKKVKQSSTASMIQMARLSDRPQRYQRCLVREGDVNLRVDQNQPDAVMPVRIVLNNKTISVFYSVEYQSVIASYDLTNLKYTRDSFNPDWCLQLSDTRDDKKQTVFCIHPANLKPESSPTAETQKWLDDIKDFKSNCNKNTAYHEIDNSLFKEREDLINREKQEEILSKLRDQDQINQNNFDAKNEDDASKMIVDQVKREIQFDSIAMQDELLREKKESDQLESSINIQEEKQACLDRTMARKQKLQEIQIKEKETQDRVNDLKKEAQKEVENSRQRTMNKISMYRALADRRKFLKKEKLLQLKVQLATRLLNEQRRGDMTLCSLKKTPAEQKEYCDQSFSDYKDKQVECNSSPVNFCFNCCEYEFGDIHEKDRDECYDQCIVEPKSRSMLIIKNSPPADPKTRTKRLNKDIDSMDEQDYDSENQTKNSYHNNDNYNDSQSLNEEANKIAINLDAEVQNQESVQEQIDPKQQQEEQLAQQEQQEIKEQTQGEQQQQVEQQQDTQGVQQVEPIKK